MHALEAAAYFAHGGVEEPQPAIPGNYALLPRHGLMVAKTLEQLTGKRHSVVLDRPLKGIAGL